MIHLFSYGPSFVVFFPLKHVEFVGRLNSTLDQIVGPLHIILSIILQNIGRSHPISVKTE